MTARVATSEKLSGRIVSGPVGLFLAVDGLLRFLEVDQYMEGTVDLGLPGDHACWIGLTLLACTVLYLMPRTAQLGVILVTGYLGGAIAAQVRAEEFGPVLFAGGLGILVWVGLAQRAVRVRNLIVAQAQGRAAGR